MSKSLKKKKNISNKKKKYFKNGGANREPYLPLKKEIDVGISDTYYYKMTHVDVIFRLTYSLFYNINQNFIFDLQDKDPKFLKILSTINKITNDINDISPDYIPTNVPLMPMASIINYNKSLCSSSGPTFRCLFPEQIAEIIKIFLYFSIRFNTGNNFDEPFFGRYNNYEISMAGRLFRIFIIILVYIDIDITIKGKSETILFNDKQIKNSIKILDRLIFENFVYTIDDEEKFKVFFSEFVNTEQDNFFLFPDNYNNYPIVIFLTLFPLRNLIEKKLMEVHPIERILDFAKYKFDVNVRLLGSKILTNKDNVNPVEYAIINCNYIAYEKLCAFIDKYKSSYFKLRIIKDESKKVFIQNYIGYYQYPSEDNPNQQMMQVYIFDINLWDTNKELADTRKNYFREINENFPKKTINSKKYNELTILRAEKRPICHRNPHFPRDILIDKTIEEDKTDLDKILSNMKTRTDFKKNIEKENNEEGNNEEGTNDHSKDFEILVNDFEKLKKQQEKKQEEEKIKQKPYFPQFINPYNYPYPPPPYAHPYPLPPYPQPLYTNDKSLE